MCVCVFIFDFLEVLNTTSGPLRMMASVDFFFFFFLLIGKCCDPRMITNHRSAAKMAKDVFWFLLHFLPVSIFRHTAYAVWSKANVLFTVLFHYLDNAAATRAKPRLFAPTELPARRSLVQRPLERASNPANPNYLLLLDERTRSRFSTIQLCFQKE